MRVPLASDLADVLDTFSGADGGVGYVKLCALLEALDAQAIGGDDDAERVLDVVHLFARLVRLAAA